MLFQNTQLHLHETAAKMRRQCPKCFNDTDFQLNWNKAGPGLGIPVVMWFTDATTITTHKQYHLACPICGYMERISRDVAKGLIAEGSGECRPTSQIAEANDQTYKPPERPMIQEIVSTEKVEQPTTKPMYDADVAARSEEFPAFQKQLDDTGGPATGSIVWVACPGCDGEVGISDRCSEATVKCPKCSTEIPRPK